MIDCVLGMTQAKLLYLIIGTCCSQLQAVDSRVYALHHRVKVPEESLPLHQRDLLPSRGRRSNRHMGCPLPVFSRGEPLFPPLLSVSPSSLSPSLSPFPLNHLVRNDNNIIGDIYKVSNNVLTSSLAHRCQQMLTSELC